MRKMFAIMLAAATGAAAALDVELEELAGKSWYGLYFNGEKAGYAVTEIAVDDDGVITVMEEARFMISMAGARQDMRTYVQRIYSPEGVLETINARVEDPSGESVFRAEIEGDTMTLRSEMGGGVAVQEAPAPTESLADALKNKRLVSGEARVGDQISYTLYDPILQQEISGSARIEEEEMRMFQGAETRVFKVRSTMEPVGLETVSYVTEDGVTLEDVIANIITMRLEPEELATDVDYSNDVIVSNAAMLDGPIPGVHERDYLQLWLRGPLAEDQLYNDNRQRLEPVNGHFFFEAVRHQLDDDFTPAQIPVENDEVSEWLEPSLFIQSGDERIIAKAREIVGDERDALQATELLCRWVYENMRTTFSAQLSNALEVLENLEGDCTEHSVLFIGLARAAGLPAREVAGLVYVANPEPGFYFHQWAKVWVGEWIDVDPTFGEVQVGPTHIKLSEGDLFEQTRLLPLIGQIEVEVIEDEDTPG